MKRLREARGQTLVFFVVLMGGLILLLAFVLNVGAVANTQRQVQSLADGAALAGVQQLPSDVSQAQTVAGQYGSCSPTNCQIKFPDQQTISVEVSRPVSGLLLPLVTTPTARATASARIEPAATLDNADLSRAGAPYLVPLIINASAVGEPSLRFGTDFGLMCVEACNGSTRPGRAIARQLNGSRELTQRYGPGPGGIASVGDAGPAGATPAVSSALAGLANQRQELTVPVYSSGGGGPFQISGFAAFRITGWDSASQTISGDFEQYMAPGHLAYPENTSANYGVSVIGLTQ